MADDRAEVAPPRPTPLIVASGLIALGGIGWYVGNLPGNWAPFLLGWIFPISGVAVAAVAAWRTGHGAHASPDARRFWRLLAITMTLFGIATLSNAHDAATGPVVPNQRISAPTMAAYVLGSLIVLWGLVRLPTTRASTLTERGRFWLDAVIVATTTGLFAWKLIFTDVFGEDGQWAALAGTPLTVFALLLMASVIALIFVKVSLAGTGTVDRLAVRILALAGVAGAFGGALQPLTADRLYLHNVIVAMPLAASMVVLAADRQRRVGGWRDPRPPRRRHSFSAVPYAAVAATDILLLGTVNAGGGEALIVAAGAVGLTCIVVYRQIAALAENSRLLHQVDTTVLKLRAAHQELAYRAAHDDLTGLPNRRQFEEQVRQALDAGECACIVLIDLDDFKTINDRLGHALGDELLVVVGQRLLSYLRTDDTVARFGGDEFALLLRGVSAAEAAVVLDRVGVALQQPISVEGYDLLVRSSVGIAETVAGAGPAELVRRADLAMYAAKERGKSRNVCYEPGLDQRAASDALLGAELRAALDRNEFHLLFQPLVRLPDGRPAGAEALVRWQHPERGLVRPDLFIAAAERTGLIVPLGAWILRESCRQAGEWLHRYGARQPWKISVNISARQLREPEFANQVAAALRAADLPASRLMVEVTETAVFDNEPAVAALTEISALGVSVALDDFGTGHSSLGLLRTTPVDVLKVDKSFVDGITGSSEEAVIATAMIQIAEGLHLGAVAEGVETLAQAERLHQLGYRLAQGFYFARPLPADEVGALLAVESRRSTSPV